MANFDEEFDKLIFVEGGYVNDKDDKGGETFMGITRKNHPTAAVWEIIDEYIDIHGKVSGLNTYIKNNIAAMKLKDGNKITTKQNAIFDIWNKYDLDSDENCIALRIATKFEMENIDTVGEFFAQVVSDFKNETTKLVKILTTGNNYSIKEYVENI